ncbi:MAG: Mut7-C RNAse domain-containing protein [Acidobacteriota bacterium]
MGVPCPRCGRDYDVTLFEFGRTIHCTCGQRVGLGPRVETLPRGGDVRFLADSMLGSLARWLRILGFDVDYESDADDEELVRRATLERRVLLTRDRRLPREWTLKRVYVVVADDAEAQVREVVKAFELSDHVEPFSRCSRCNAPLQELPPEEARREVPPYVARTVDRFGRCPDCGRVYWKGTHTDDMRRRLEAMLGAELG